MSARPWHKRYHSDALTGYACLSLEQRGAYTTLLDAMYDTGGEPGIIDNERRIAGLLDVSTRRWRVLRAELIELGKIEERDGLLTNSRYLRELEKQRRISEKRANAGQKGGKAKAENSQGKLDLEDDKSLKDKEACLANAKQVPNDCQNSENGPENPVRPSKTDRTDAFSTPENDLSQTRKVGEQERKPAQNGETGLANAKQNPSYTRATPEARDQSLEPYRESPSSTLRQERAPRIGDDDEFPTLDQDEPQAEQELETPETDPDEKPREMLARVDLLARKAGLNITVPAKLSRAIDQLKEWIEEGIDFDCVIVPTIDRITAENPRETVHSLRYFDGAVRKAAAIAGNAKAKPVAPPPPPPPPIDLSDQDDERVVKFRQRAAYHVGAQRYASRYAEDHVAIEIHDDRLLTMVFRSSNEERLCKFNDDTTFERIATGLGLRFTTRAIDRGVRS